MGAEPRLSQPPETRDSFKFVDSCQNLHAYKDMRAIHRLLEKAIHPRLATILSPVLI
jgi:hypothetical protein